MEVGQGAASREGEVFGEQEEFVLRSKIGNEALGPVYLAWQPKLEREAHVRILERAYGLDRAVVSRSFAEVEAAQRLMHPNIVRIYSYGVCGSIPYVGVEASGSDSLLKQMLRAPKGQMDPVLVMQAIKQVLAGLSSADLQGFHHGSINPESILLTDRGVAMIGGFGMRDLVRAIGDCNGMQYYVAPEVIRDEPVDARTDIYSLGALLYHALTGAVPFEGSNLWNVALSQSVGTYVKASVRRPSLTARVDLLLARMLAQNPNDRYQDYGHLESAFATVLESGPVADESEMEARKTAQQNRTTRTIVRLRSQKLATGALRTRALASVALSAPAPTPAPVSAPVDNPAPVSVPEPADAAPSGEAMSGEAASKSASLPLKTILAESAKAHTEDRGFGRVIVAVALALTAVVGYLVWRYRDSAHFAQREATRIRQEARLDESAEALSEVKKQVLARAAEVESVAQEALNVCRNTAFEVTTAYPQLDAVLRPLAASDPAAARDLPAPIALPEALQGQPAVRQAADGVRELWRRAYKCAAWARQTRQSADAVVEACGHSVRHRRRVSTSIAVLEQQGRAEEMCRRMMLSDDLAQVRRELEAIRREGKYLTDRLTHAL